MKYKVGDKIKIRTWESMKEEYGLDIDKDIKTGSYLFTLNKEQDLNNLNSDRIISIISIISIITSEKNIYTAEHLKGWHWTDNMIECLVEPEVFEPVNSRFELLDL